MKVFQAITATTKLPNKWETLAILSGALSLLYLSDISYYSQVIKSLWLHSDTAKVLILGTLLYVILQLLHVIIKVLKRLSRWLLRFVHLLVSFFIVTKRIVVWGALVVTVYTFMQTDSYQYLKLKAQVYYDYWQHVRSGVNYGTDNDNYTAPLPQTQPLEYHSSGFSYKDAYEALLKKLEQEKQPATIEQDTVTIEYNPMQQLQLKDNNAMRWTITK